MRFKISRIEILDPPEGLLLGAITLLFGARATLHAGESVGKGFR